MPNQKAKRSTLLTLPPELRNCIYDLVLQDTTTVVRLAIRDELLMEKPKSKPFELPPLLKTCKQVYTEASMLFYKCTIFYTAHEFNIYTWLRVLHPKYRQAITEIHVDTVKQLEYSGYSTRGEGEQMQLDILTNRLREECGIEFADGVLKVNVGALGGKVWTTAPQADAQLRLGVAPRRNRPMRPWTGIRTARAFTGGKPARKTLTAKLKVPARAAAPTTRRTRSSKDSDDSDGDDSGSDGSGSDDSDSDDSGGDDSDN